MLSWGVKNALVHQEKNPAAFLEEKRGWNSASPEQAKKRFGVISRERVGGEEGGFN